MNGIAVRPLPTRAELTRERARLVNMVIGLGVFLFGVAFNVIVEIIAVIARGGVL